MLYAVSDSLNLSLQWIDPNDGSYRTVGSLVGLGNLSALTHVSEPGTLLLLGGGVLAALRRRVMRIRV